jgi:hypothetical protein
MKTRVSILVQMVFLLLLSRLSFSQEVEVNLGGISTSDAFVVRDSSGNVLLKMDGDRNFGINSDHPDGIEIKGRRGTTGVVWDGDPINIIGGGSTYGKGGSVSIIGGSANYDAGNGGSVIISSGNGNDVGGKVDITTGGGGEGGGSINISTHHGQSAGSITISTGHTNDVGGAIKLSTGFSNGGGNNIILQTGGTVSYEDGNRIELKDFGIEIIPTGLLEIIGSGTYTGTWTQASDERYKRNIKPLLGNLDGVKMLKPVEYEWNKEEYPENNFPDGNQIGLIAQEVEKLFPEMVATNQDGYKSIDYSKLSVLLIQAMKEQQNEIEKQSAENEKQSYEIKEQSGEINKMKSELEELKSMIMRDSNKFSSNYNLFMED